MFNFQNVNLFSSYCPIMNTGMNTASFDWFCAEVLSNLFKQSNQIADYNKQFLSDVSLFCNEPQNNKLIKVNNNNFRPYNYTKYGNNADKISLLDPKMQEKTMMLLDYAKSIGLDVKITSGYRTQERQAQLCKEKPKYAAKNSLHCQGKAIDISIKNGTDSDYKKLADYAKSIGMRWGGDFKTFPPERWHFDLGA